VDVQRGDSWVHGSMAMTLFNTVVPPNGENDSWTYCANTGSGSASQFSNSDSYHPGGVNVLMADGHVQFIKNSINLTTWWNLGTIAGGEVIDASSY
jgi:prepilin-type processing-associated H-X9-DG protein